MIARDRLARLHLVNTLFHQVTGHDLYLAQQVLDAIELLTDENPELAHDADSLTRTLERLHEQLTGHEPDAAFTYLDCAAPGAPGPLWLRQSLLQALRRHATARQSTVLVSQQDANPSAPIKSKRKRSSRHNRDQAETLKHLRDLAVQRSNPKSLVTLLVV